MLKLKMMKKSNLRIFILLALTLFFIACDKDEHQPELVTNEIVESFRIETGLQAVFVSDTALLNSVTAWQGQGDYPGVDQWSTAKIPNNFDLYGGLPGQSEYYTISSTLTLADTLQQNYWESLQVKENVQFGYRPMVGVFEMKDTLVVALAKTLANPQYGSGGAWQIYVKDFAKDLTVLDTVYLKD